MNNKVKFLRGTSGEYAVAEKDSDAIYFTTDDGKLYIGDKEVSGDGSVTIDDTLSDTSTNPVQNKVVKQAIDNKADKTVATTSADGLMSASDKGKLDAFEITATGGKLHDKDIATTDLIPTSLPANGGNADTVDNKHYTDFSQNAIITSIDQVNDSNLESGIYSVENVGMYFTSTVSSNWFMLIVNKHRNSLGYGTQIAIPYDGGVERGLFYRTCSAGSWQSWQEIITSENGVLTGTLVAQSNTAYSTPQVRNATMSTSAPSGGSNGQIHYQYS